ncbi:pyocin knob domain-containing protein [Levilactobacillus brevis]|uniref:Pyocin knob domain-containing protein n=1 Tax=Levilactobacillus brevis TaxID=1580 RepID=A0AB38X9D0_LEVBR|nr:pyocin knob domain-containing protein [Levilactobacillus brevis]WAD02576.1 pyocin knob domain-containing protein [Levilactobacillus brevis]
MASNDEQRSATTIITTAAQSIAARLIANETTAKFTKAEISTTNLFNQSVTELQVLTSLDNVQQTADINTVTVINNNTVNVNVAIDQTKAPNNYQMNSVGLFAVDGDGKEVLYSVTVLKDPVYIHQDAMGSALGIDLETVVGQASNVEISVNPAGAVTNEILKAALADYVKADDSTVVHTADMRKPASDVAGIEEVNAKQDAIAYTPADDSKVVHDNKNGTEQLNGIQVQPFNKLSDTIGGRNLLLGTSSVKVRNPTWDKIINVDVTNLVGETLTYSVILDITDSKQGAIGVSLTPQDSSGKPIGDTVSSNSINWGNAGKIIATITIPAGASNLSIEERTNNTDQNPLAGSRKLEKGSIATDWTPAPEDKVNVSDMRKPASDVAGIEEVNTKQDKLTITPADDSKVVHDNHDNTITANGTSYDLSKSGLTSLQTIDGGSFNDLPLGTVFARGLADSPDNSPAFTTTTFYSSAWGGRKVQIAIADNTNRMFTRIFNDGIWTGWNKLADDSKVAHLSGANNFDTTPTVNSYPLLLASSLPSDLARLSQDANFTAKLQQNGQDVALANNTIARNPDTGVVSKPTDFTNLTVNGGKSVATRDDLKSLEASAWRPLTLANSTSGTILFKDNGDGTASLTGSANFTIAKGTTTLTPVITPPTGYTFTSLKWSKGTNNKGVYVTGNMTGVSYGISYIFDTSLSNGDICFLGSYDNTYTVTFSPSELTTLNTAAACNPALVSISKV